MIFKFKKEYINLINLTRYFFLIIFFIKFIGEISSGNNYSWDTDHEMYFGTRLLNGELLYTSEMHDKLPLVQYFFALPAFFKSLNVWIFFSTFVSLFASLSLRNILIRIISEAFPRIKLIDVCDISNFCGSFYLFAISSLSGSLHMINHFASSCYLISLISILNYSYKFQKLEKFKSFFNSLLFGSIAISFRPYFAPPIVLFGIWIPLRKLVLNDVYLKVRNFIKPKKDDLKFLFNYLMSFISWGLLLLFFIILLNIIPYLDNNIGSFINGIKYNSTSLHSKNILSVFVSQIFRIPFGFTTFTISASTIVFSIYLSFSYLKGLILNQKVVNKGLYRMDVFFIGFLSPVLLEIAILNKHFWDHYYQLFIPFIVFPLAYLLSFLRTKYSYIGNIEIVNKANFSFLLVFLIAVSSLEVETSIRSLSNYGKEHPMEVQVRDIKKFLNWRDKNNLKVDFLHPSSMYVHWKLDESRHGFPHAANVGHIKKNYFENLKDIYGIQIPKNSTELCNKLNNSAISIIFTDNKTKYLNKCLNNSDSNYIKSESNQFLSNQINLFLYDDQK